MDAAEHRRLGRDLLFALAFAYLRFPCISHLDVPASSEARSTDARLFDRLCRLVCNRARIPGSLLIVIVKTSKSVISLREKLRRNAGWALRNFMIFRRRSAMPFPGQIFRAAIVRCACLRSTAHLRNRFCSAGRACSSIFGWRKAANLRAHSM